MSIKHLENLKVKNLSKEEKQFLFTRIIQKSNSATSSTKLDFIRFIFKTNMGLAAILIAILIGGGGTVLAANEAGPGDALFAIDQGMEEVRYALAGEEGKEKLKVKYAKERVEELQEVLVEDTEDIEDSATQVVNQAADLSTSTITEVEVDVFTDMTVVKIEASDEKYYFTTSTLDPALALAEAAIFYNIEAESLTSIATVEIEDRESRPKDLGVAIEDLDEDAELSYQLVEEALSSIGGSSEVDSLTTIVASILGAYVGSEVVEEIDLRLSDGTRINIDEEDFRLKSDDIDIRIKDGEVKIKDKDDDDIWDIDGEDEDEDDDKGHGNDDDGVDDDNPGSGNQDDDEDEDEDESGDDSDDDSQDDDEDDNSGSDDEDDDNEDEDEDEGEDEDEDEDEDDDNSGSGSDDDEDEGDDD